MQLTDSVDLNISLLCCDCFFCHTLILFSSFFLFIDCLLSSLACEGIFIFDLNTVYKYRELLGENTISESREESSFIWDNYFYEDEMVNEYDLTLFIREQGDLYRKYEEIHYQKAYELETVKRLLEEAGMEFVAAYDAFTHDPVRKDSERIYIIAREHGKTV